MGTLLMFIAYALFCLLVIILILAIFKDLTIKGRRLILLSLVILVIAIIVLYNQGSTMRLEQIDALQY
ncbi:hypothetical protein BU600_04615 [Staphylococcus arlettae]|uniref:Uncharacterized protein n=1 Tax=Staphylococcus arlettae TaxID=29378 RepID=A0A2T7BRG1_9STAP|nr:MULTISPECIES: hypothetical protein [Staphylococcus]EJY96000.1 hypothetical protein SARL_04811 [Staphylococcus arlettae CVD059]ERF48180.1 hypothetical protein N039_04745 [Staphylococcus sp. EGD-HP3]MBF0738742.1 hypothetical protein [Staphylococcus arlettae]MBK3720019.1 hypothetical protein [Staphylococcus arlettae]MCD8815738.1 hypothetical protein [Staphylococcus arlettae]